MNVIPILADRSPCPSCGRARKPDSLSLEVDVNADARVDSRRTTLVFCDRCIAEIELTIRAAYQEAPRT